MAKFLKIIKQAQSEEGPVIHGTSIDVYHRTKDQEIVGNICESGFIAGMGAMYGVGIYANYTLKSAMGRYGLRAYGGIVVRGSVDLNKFLIFDYNIAKQIYGDNYRLPDQAEKVIGWNALLPSASSEEIEVMKKRFWKAHDSLKGGRGSSRVAQTFFPSNYINVNGILFTGGNDGNTVVVFNGSLVIPKAHAFIDQRTKSSFKWKSCSESSAETFEAMIEASNGSNWEQVNRQRTNLIKDVSEKKHIDASRKSYPLLPDVVFDNIIISALYEDKTKTLSEKLENRLKDVYPSKILLKKLQSEPLLYWKEFKKADDSIKSKISEVDVKNTWQSFVDENPLKWAEIPSEVKSIVDKSAVTDHYTGMVSDNAANLMHVPKDLIKAVKGNVKITDKKLQEMQERQKESDVVYEQSDVFNIPISSMGWFENEIEKLNRKASKLGLSPIIIDVVEEDIKAYTKKIKITRNVPILKGGWELVAKIIPIRDEETGNVINTLQKLGTKAVPEEYLEVDAQCQHCNTKRKRNEIFVLYSNEKNNYIMVGSTCLNEFIGEYALRPDQVARYAEQLQQTISMFRNSEKFSSTGRSSKDTRRDFKKTGVPLPYFLSRCVMAMKNGGYVTGGEAFREQKTSTGQIAYNACISEDIDNSIYQELSSDDMVWVDSTIDWLYGLGPDDVKGNDYLYSLSTVAKLGVANKSNKNYLASALNAYKKFMADQVINTDQVIDKMGSEIFFSGSLIDKRPLFFSVSTGASPATKSNYCIAKNSSGDIIVWGDNSGLSVDIGDPVSIKGKVVGFKFVDDSSATIVGNVELINPETFLDNKDAQESRTGEFREEARGKPQKIVYKDGDKISSMFEVSKAKPTSRGNIYYQVQDDFGTRLSLFAMPPQRFNEGDSVHVEGTVSLDGRFINVNNPIISDEHGNSPEEIVEGETEKIFFVNDTFSDNYGNEKFSLVDSDGNQFEAGMTKSTSELNVGDYAKLKGTVKAGFRGVWKLLRVKLIDKSSSFSKDQEDKEDQEDQEDQGGKQKDQSNVSPVVDSDEKSKETEDVVESNWYRKGLVKEGK